ncbi:MAG: efflux RND transporter periplasmic adaptor subunit [Lachnospiraceae bacterium]|nr:efflux RND transporter periplasmic adaptor subunit [Lachnospiraceae bacterium]
MKAFAHVKKVMLLGLAVLLAGCSSASGNDGKELLNSVNAKLESTRAERLDLNNISVYNGRILPAVEEISFDTDGYLYGLYVNAGTSVEEGEVLASLVSRNYDAMNRLKDEIKRKEESNSEYFKKLDADLELALLAGEDVEEKEIKIRHEKETAELELKLKKDKLAYMAEDDIGYHYITAPRDCVVLAATNVNSKGFMKAGTSVVAIDADGELMLTCEYINEKKVKGLYEYYALINGKRYELEYVPYSKSQLKELSVNDITLMSKFRIKGSGNFKAGDYAAVITVADYKPDVLAVPINAIYSDSSGKFVYVIEDNVRVKRNVTTGISDFAYIEILDGLEEGALVYVKN